MPAPAIAGLNTPVAALVIPVPLHVPPAVAGCKVIAAAVEHIFVTGQILISQQVNDKVLAAVNDAIDCIYPVRVAVPELPVEPQAITSPAVLTCTS